MADDPRINLAGVAGKTAGSCLRSNLGGKRNQMVTSAGLGKSVGFDGRVTAYGVQEL
jgi:hypothetical protein